MAGNFDNLTPEVIVAAAERGLGRAFAPVAIPFPSYINRVYELRGSDGAPVVIKFYRPGRWSRAALEEEHALMRSCAECGVPAVLPLALTSGGTLGVTEDGIFFAIYPKMSGRRFEVTEPGDWNRLGRLAALVHCAGERLPVVANRPVLTPCRSTRQAVERLNRAAFIPEQVKGDLSALAGDLIDFASPLVDDCELLAVHGDLHDGNIIRRPGEGTFLIDFDDMAVAPAAQDLWLLLPGRACDCPGVVERVVAGYRELRDLETPSWELLESLRAMRMFYYLDWCARQHGDFMFDRLFPEWSAPGFWRNEIGAIADQIDVLYGRVPEGGTAEDEEDDSSWL